jgi:glycosyltransferase involved in cell wall biosynthesis
MTAKTSPRLSVILITKNEESDIFDCLASIAFCDEIIVVDSGSTDSTCDLARHAGAKVITTTTWRGFGPQKQIALDSASGDWVLSIDADERVTEKLKRQIMDVVADNDDFSYALSRENYFLGRRMRFGGWAPDLVLRLAKRSGCCFSTDVVHESLTSSHKTKVLTAPLTHHSYRSVDELFEKQIQYARLGSERVLERRHGSEPRHPLLPALKASWTFFRLYLFRLGFLDGWRGLVASIAKSYETFWRYMLAQRFP